MQKSASRPARWVVLLCLGLLAAFRLLYFHCLDRFMAPDSYEYIARDGFAWLHGTVDRYRLPLYPMLIDLCQALAGDWGLELLTLLQLALSLLSVWVLYVTLRRLTDRGWVSLLCTLLYGCLNAVSGWDKTILTESLSLSLTVFLLWGVVSWLRAPKLRYALLTALVLVLGCFLRAVFALYAGVVFGFFLLQLCFPGRREDPALRRKQRKAGGLGLLVTAVPVLLVLLYAFTFQARYGALTLSDSGLGQQLYLVLAEGYYEDCSDTELRDDAKAILDSRADSKSLQMIDNFLYEFYHGSGSRLTEEDRSRLRQELLSRYAARLDPGYEADLEGYIQEEYQNDYDLSFTTSKYLARLWLMENYPRDRIVRFVSEAKRLHLRAYLAGLIYHAFERFDSRYKLREGNLAALVSGLGEYGLFFLHFSLVHCLLAALIEGLAFLLQWIRQKRICWIRLGLCVLPAATCLLSIVGTCGSYARTAITALPFLFAAFALWAEDLLRRRQSA